MPVLSTSISETRCALAGVRESRFPALTQFCFGKEICTNGILLQTVFCNEGLMPARDHKMIKMVHQYARNSKHMGLVVLHIDHHGHTYGPPMGIYVARRIGVITEKGHLRQWEYHRTPTNI